MGANHMGRSMGERLAIDPNWPDIMYFASRQNGLMKSTDGGKHWAQVNHFPSKGEQDIGLSFVCFDSSSGSAKKASATLYVGVTATGKESNLYCSKDSGWSWQELENGPSGLIPHKMIMDREGVVYIACNDGPGPYGITKGEIWKFNMSTGSWKNVSPKGAGGGFGGITISNSDQQIILVCTIDWWKPDEIYRSADGGNPWEGIGRSAQKDRNGADYLCWRRPGCTNLSWGGWMGDIDIDPFNPDRAFYVTGQGIWISDNINDEPEKIVWKFENTGLEETVALDLTPSINGALFSAVGDLGGFRHPEDELDQPVAGGMFDNPIFGNTDGIDFAALNTNIVVRCGTNYSTHQNGAFSTDNGVTWSPFPVQPEKDEHHSGGKIAVSADGSSIVWRINKQFYYSPDMGNTWTKCKNLKGPNRITADKVNPEKFYAYSESKLYMSDDGGASFSVVARNIKGSGWRDRVNTVFGKEGDIWLVAGEHLYRSVSSGSDPVRINPVEKIYTIGFGKAFATDGYPTLFIVGVIDGVYGVFRSFDEGENWVRINDDQHQYGSMDYIAGDENIFGRVYIGTHGRGIVYGDPVK
ncbi:Xyloglucanase [subsurface metagenome]